jgi:hypothetical protein
VARVQEGERVREAAQVQEGERVREVAQVQEGEWAPASVLLTCGIDCLCFGSCRRRVEHLPDDPFSTDGVAQREVCLDVTVVVRDDHP